MARPLRIEFPGAVYHVTARGDGRGATFRDNADRSAFLEILGHTAALRGWLCHAYCLMGNHYHLLIETPQANLSRGMRSLNGEYTQAFNRRHHRPGHVFQGRFKAVLVEKEAHLLELCRYVVLNPVRARHMKVSGPEGWPWSSYRATAGREAAPSFLTVDWILSRFGGGGKDSRRRYARFVAQGKGVPPDLPAAKGGFIMGGESFIESVKPQIALKRGHEEHKVRKRRTARPGLPTLFKGNSRKGKAARDSAIREAYIHYGYTLAEIGEFLGLHYATISRIVRQATP